VNAGRREFLKSAVAVTASAALFSVPTFARGAAPRVVVVGGGFAGASCARALRKADPGIAVTLVEANATFTACPFSNAVIGGLRELSAQQFTYERVAADGIVIARATATAVDAQARSVTLADGARLPYDRLVLAPGIDIRWGALPGYDEAAAAQMPHAWRAGDDDAVGGHALVRELLRAQLSQAPDHRVAERTGGEHRVRLDHRHGDARVDLPEGAGAARAGKAPSDDHDTRSGPLGEGPSREEGGRGGGRETELQELAAARPHRCVAYQAAMAWISASVNPLAIRSMTVAARFPERNSSIALTIRA